jgi:hypothetical protein
MSLSSLLDGVDVYSPTGDGSIPIPRCTGNFFSCDSSSKIKNAKSGKNHPKMDVARLGFRKTNVGARKAGLVT